MSPPVKKEKAKKVREPKSDSPFSLLARRFTEAKQYFAAFTAAIVAFGVLQSQIARINWNNWVADIGKNLLLF